MKYAVFTGTLAVLLSPVAAFAGGYVAPADPAPVAPVAAAPAPVGYDWSGFYGGIQLEYGDVDANTLAGADAADGDGVLYGVFGGYRYDLGNIVVGAELDLNWADIDLDDPVGTTIGSLDSVHRLGAEVGYDAGPALLYGTVGVAQASATVGGADLQDNGYFFGAGVDYLVTDQIILGAEVLQHEFEDFDNSGLDISATTFGVSAAFRF
ncbi:outer membrane beta-barrel protein [Rhodobacteraceae bacterium N5(2021)]|uniref:Outer membrane beta-barrel protein n=1 Tax=Gymnodinialimonas phycosphaerae TaxID=2841589 RepID=A0A975YGL0_9RHOB|nr:outer membrane beta-barrel protein [Gymnodinialimonas phycosphaerae]MBY4891757.1 outer membrane beta-barrel protein [Gymnodinialimonas phycosphaerae]